MTGPIAIPNLPADPVTRAAFLDLTSNMAREGISGFSYAVPLYDDGDLVRVVGAEESSAGPKDVTATGGSWDVLVSATLDLEEGVDYRVHGTASCHFHAKSGTSQETLEVRVHDGTNTLHSLKGTSASDDWETPVCVPFTLEFEAKGPLTFSMDGNHTATGGSNPEVENMRLIVVAVPIKLEGAL